MAASLGDYRAALSSPGAAAPVLASVLGRLPISMLSLSALLYVQGVSGSYAFAGAVSAGTLVGIGVGMIVQGRLLDRVGPTRPLLLFSAAYLVMVAALFAGIELGAGLAVLVPIALVTGLVTPAIEGSSRALWTDLVPAGPRREAAYAYESISLEVFFILGPALAAVLVTTTPWPGTAMAVAVTAEVTGTVWFALTRATRTRTARIRAARTGTDRTADSAAPGRTRLSGVFGVMARPGMRTVALASLGFGLTVGSVEVGVLAATSAAGAPAMGGVLLSAWSVVSVLAGVLYGMRPWPRELHLRFPVLLAGFSVLVVVLALVAPSGSVLLLALVMFVAGALITPQTTAHSLGVELAAPGESATEAFNWVVTAVVFGVSVGQSLAGLAVDVFGPVGFVTGGVLGLVVAGLLWALRGTLAADARVPAGTAA
ncbi:MFS transporter [Pseudonocardia sp. KRD291]|uniref:MFS transporter n=1 Tax=Pseudonocardia sp. KRD291 TaxID=2792007 RepID=UPI001C4A1670|nr:MFS transporter [Pseudonocardia sp. KRD291]MBW0106255.1 MFS transporter [Pseudonocardia sp. KRD291]